MKLSHKFAGLTAGLLLCGATTAQADNSMTNDITVKPVSGGFVAKSTHESCTTDKHLVTTKNGLYFVTSAHTHFAYYIDKSLTNINQIYRDNFNKMLSEDFRHVVSLMTADEFRTTFKSTPPTESMRTKNTQIDDAQQSFMRAIKDRVDDVAKLKGKAYETKISKTVSPRCP